MLRKLKIEIIKIQDIKISKIWKGNFVRILETKIQEKFEKIQKVICGSSILQFWLPC